MTANSETRFAHLLEPIRDIAQNWSIDIALELEDYLTELESITISFDDGKQVDFTEAALLIQGSACVYSKKVEHLYSLVYKALNQVIEKREKNNAERKGGAADGDSSSNSNMLPPGVGEMRQGTLGARVVLQVDEVVDVGAAARDRYAGCGSAGSGAPVPARATRVLKLQLTDGVQRVAAIEYRYVAATRTRTHTHVRTAVEEIAHARRD